MPPTTINMQPALDFVPAIGHPLALDLEATIEGWQQALDNSASVDEH